MKKVKDSSWERVHLFLTSSLLEKHQVPTKLIPDDLSVGELVECLALFLVVLVLIGTIALLPIW
jgi:hypothetical protein